MHEAIAQLAQKAKAAKKVTAKSQPAEESSGEEEQEAEEEVSLTEFSLGGVVCRTPQQCKSVICVLLQGG